MDPRISVGENYVYIILLDLSRESFALSRYSAPDKYLYPDTLSEEFGGPGGVHPIFYLDGSGYYFDVPVIGKVNVVPVIGKVNVVPASAHEQTLPAAYTVSHYEYNMATMTITLESSDGSKHTYPSANYPVEYLQPERFVGWWDDGTPIFELGSVQFRFGFIGDGSPVIFHLTYLDAGGPRLTEEELAASDPVEIQYAEYLPRKHPDVYKAFWKALKNLGGDLSYWEYITLMKKKAPKYGYVLSPVSADRVGLYKILLEYLYHTGVMATSSDLNYDLTRDQKMAYPTWDPYENKANFAATRRGYSKWIACRLACRPETLPVPNNPNIVKVQTDELGYAIVSNTNSAWIEKRDEWPMQGLRVRNRNEELFDWYNSRSFAYYVMGHVPYEKGDVSEFPVSPCGKPEFEEYKQRFEFMPVKEIDISIRKTWDWCQLYNYNVSDHEGVGLYPKINTLQVQGFMFSNFNCTVGYTLDEAINGLTAEAAIYRGEDPTNLTAMVGYSEHRQPPKRVFPLLQLDAEHTEIVDLMYEYNKRFYRLNMYERRVYMTKNTTAKSSDPSDVRGDYWLYSRYDVEYQERSSAWFPQSKRVARDPVNTYPLAADDAVALSYDAIQQDKIRSKFGFVWVEVGVSVLAGVLTTLAVQYLGQDIQVSVISGGVVLFTGLLITLILNLGDIIRSVAGETVALGKESVGL